MAIEWRTMADAATDALRELILSGKLEEGVPLRQDILANQLGVSRTPLREAITRLDSEGLVRQDRHKGAVVRKPTATELHEVYEIRELLECRAGRRAVDYVARDEIEHLEGVLARFEQADSVDEWAHLNTRFHMEMYAIGRQRQLYDLISKLRNRSESFVRLLVAVPGRSDQAQEDHREILDALADRDREGVESAISQHLRNTVAAVAHDLESSKAARLVSEEPDRK